MADLTFIVTFSKVECADCAIAFAITKRFEDAKRYNHSSFYCPNGHKQYFSGKTDAEIERDKALKAQAELNRETHEKVVLEKKLRESEKEMARMKNRAAHGVCLCCNRTFENLASHMKTQHPAEIPGGAAVKQITNGAVSVEHLELGVRAYNVLKNRGIETLDEVCRMTATNIKNLKNAGSVTVREIEDAIAKHGRTLAQ